MTGVVTVGGGASVSPASTRWDPWAITRITTDEATLGYWQAQIETGATTISTSDGDSTSTVVPRELPADLVDQFDADVITSQGCSLVRYDAAPADD